MSEKLKVGILGGTGMVGQRFALLLAEHPWFDVTVLAASSRSAGLTYKEALGGRWRMTEPTPEKYLDMTVLDAEKDIEKIASLVDFVFCAVNLDKAATKALEEKYAKAECPVVSNNSAHRFTPDVPMVVPELNADHIEVVADQRKRLGTKRGFIAVKSNCSLQSYVPAIYPLDKAGYKVEDVLAVGDEVDVKLLEIDAKTGKMRLSRRALMEKPEGYVEPERRPRPSGDRDRRDDRRGGDRRDSRGPRRDGDRRDDRRGDRRDNRGPRRDAPKPETPEFDGNENNNDPEMF